MYVRASRYGSEDRKRPTKSLKLDYKCNRRKGTVENGKRHQGQMV